MPAIQTYAAREIRPGYVAYHRDHKGPVRSTGQHASGALDFRVFCETHGRNETWKNIPRHSAVHAERAV